MSPLHLLAYLIEATSGSSCSLRHHELVSDSAWDGVGADPVLPLPGDRAVLRPVRRIIKPMGGLDFSFLIVILVAQIVLIPCSSADSAIAGIAGVGVRLGSHGQFSGSLIDPRHASYRRVPPRAEGYNVDEVDEYLDKAAQEAEALQDHVRN